jgi:4-amino-4-deoxy-L-arabinose transferase-like glycosyltransferase
LAAFFWREPEVIIDTSRYFTQAKYLELYGPVYFIREWGREIFAWTDQPLVPFLYGLIFRVFGESRAFIQAFTSLLFSLTALLTYLTGKALWDRERGAIAGWLFLGIPYLFTQVPLMLVDVPTMFFFVLSVYSFIRALEADKFTPWAVLSGAAVFLTFISKYSTGLMLSVLPVAFVLLIIKGGNRKNVFKNALLAFLVCAVLSSIFFLLKRDVILSQLRFLSSYQVPGLRRWGESFISTFFFQVHPFITLFALFSLYMGIRRRDMNFLIAAFLPLLVLFTGLRRIRYIVMVFPMLALMAAFGFGTLKQVAIKRFIVLSVLAMSISLSLGGFLPYLMKESSINIKNAGFFLYKTNVPGVEVFTVNTGAPVNPAVSVPELDLFTDKNIHYKYENPFSGTALPQDLLVSPFRFTWEFRNPPYYESRAPAGSAVVVIATAPRAPLPPLIREKIAGLREAARFQRTSVIFRFQTFVTVYLP